MTSLQQPLLGPEADLPSPVDDFTPTFYIGHHESKRPLPVTDFVLRQAQDVGVSMSVDPRVPVLRLYSMTCSRAQLRALTSILESSL